MTTIYVVLKYVHPVVSTIYVVLKYVHPVVPTGVLAVLTVSTISLQTIIRNYFVLAVSSNSLPTGVRISLYCHPSELLSAEAHGSCHPCCVSWPRGSSSSEWYLLVLHRGKVRCQTMRLRHCFMAFSLRIPAVHAEVRSLYTEHRAIATARCTVLLHTDCCTYWYFVLFWYFHFSYKYEVCPFHNVTQHEQSTRWNAYKGVLG